METTPILPSLVATGSPPKRASNHLTRMQNADLIVWMRQEENTAFVAKESDRDAAIKASADLGFPLTPANITGTRNALKIEKLRPAAPESTDPSLADLQRRLLAAESRIEALQVKATSMDDAIALLRQQLTLAESRLAKLERRESSVALAKEEPADLTAAPFNG